MSATQLGYSNSCHQRLWLSDPQVRLALISFRAPLNAFTYWETDCCTASYAWSSAGTAVFAATHSMKPSLGHMPAPRASAKSSQYFSWQFLAFAEPATGSPPGGMQFLHAGS